jgi:hypothetical protein
MSIPPGSRTAPPADADDLRVEHITAQLEEAEQQRLTENRIEEHDVIAEAPESSMTSHHQKQRWGASSRE